MRAQRSFDVEIGVFGAVKSGKTDKAVSMLLQIQKREAIYAIAHDVSYNIPNKLHDGTVVKVHRHHSIQAAEEALNRSPSGIHAIAEENADRVIDLAIRVADQSMVRHTPGGRPAIQNGMGRGIPVVLYLDEIVDAESANPHRVGTSIKRLVSKRRALNVGLIFSSQFPRQAHYSLGMQATDIVFFHLDGKKDIQRLYEDYGVPEDIALEAKSLVDHQYIHFDKSTKKIYRGK